MSLSSSDCLHEEKKNTAKTIQKTKIRMLLCVLLDTALATFSSLQLNKSVGEVNGREGDPYIELHLTFPFVF